MASSVLTYLLVCGLTLALSWFAADLLGVGPVEVRRGGGTGLAVFDSQYAFGSARGRHDRARLRASLTFRRSALTLPVLPCPDAGGWDEGEQDVLLSEIVGTVDGRHHPIDRNFDPSEDSAWGRFSRAFGDRDVRAQVTRVAC